MVLKILDVPAQSYLRSFSAPITITGLGIGLYLLLQGHGVIADSLIALSIAGIAAVASLWLVRSALIAEYERYRARKASQENEIDAAPLLPEHPQ